MGTNCAPLVADIFLFCYEREFMMSLSDDKQAGVIDAFNTTSRYLDDILNILKTKSNFTLSTTEYIFTVFDFDQIKYCNELLVPALTQFTKIN